MAKGTVRTNRVGVAAPLPRPGEISSRAKGQGPKGENQEFQPKAKDARNRDWCSPRPTRVIRDSESGPENRREYRESDDQEVADGRFGVSPSPSTKAKKCGEFKQEAESQVYGIGVC
jgi:hypothetical protein